jgi:hypothetical protein
MTPVTGDMCLLPIGSSTSIHLVFMVREVKVRRHRLGHWLAVAAGKRPHRALHHIIPSHALALAQGCAVLLLQRWKPTDVVVESVQQPWWQYLRGERE